MTDETDTTDQTARCVPAPVDVHDGVPDSAETPSRRRLPVLLAIYAIWLAVLVYMWLGGR